MMLTTPTAISEPILQFCEALVPHSAPVWVVVQPEADGQFDNCFDVVDSVIIRRGGIRQDGWLICEWPGILLEAIFHAVHVQPPKPPVDVTVKEDQESRILFLPDPSRTYVGELVDSHYYPLIDDKLVHDYIQTAQEMTDVRRSVSPDGLGEMPRHRWSRLKLRLRELLAAIEAISNRRQVLAALQPQAIETDDEIVRSEIYDCHRLVSDGDFRAAMDRGIQLVNQNRTRFGEPVRQFMLNVFHAVSDQPELVKEYQRKLGKALY